jgi:hypothetical protein
VNKLTDNPYYHAAFENNVTFLILLSDNLNPATVDTFHELGQRQYRRRYLVRHTAQSCELLVALLAQSTIERAAP